jgi:hypothetical protein
VPISLSAGTHPAVHHTAFHWNLGDLPTWIGSIATVGALAAAVFAGIVARRLYDIESQRDREAAEDRKLASEDRRIAADDRRRAEQDRLARIEEGRRAQADKVAAWFDERHMIPKGMEYPEQVLGAVIRNSSDLPIYDVGISFVQLSSKVSSTRTKAVDEASDVVSVVPPADERFAPARYNQPLFMDPGWDGTLLVEMSFRDAAGNRWRRDMNGVLTEEPP